MNYLTVANFFNETELLKPLLVFLLPPDVFPYRLLIFASCRDVALTCPKVFSQKVLLATTLRSLNMNRTLHFAKTHRLRHHILRWNHHHKVHMIPL
jgi:hypothetical protein